MNIIYTVPLLVLSFAVHPAHGVELPGIPEFIDEMVTKHNFKRVELEKVFAHAEHQPSIIEAISRPATTRPWLEYRAAFVNPERIGLGLKFWNKYRQTLQRAERKYGVPQEIILAVIGVETVYGQDAGKYRTIDALTTLAFDYPRRSEFFRDELENYLLLAREQQLDLLAIRGSYAGALGIAQFMPSSYRNYAVDFNGNHRIDLLREDRDAIGSVANYLQTFGWDTGRSVTGGSLPNKTAAQPLVAVRVQVGEQNSIGEAAATRPLVAWLAAGVVSGENIDQSEEPFDAGLDRLLAEHPDETARMIDFTVTEGKQFWLVFNNFEVIARYNNSDFYAMSVFQLAEALKAARKSATTKTGTPKEPLNK